MNPNKYYAVVTALVGSGKYTLTPIIHKNEAYGGTSSAVDSFVNADAAAAATIDAYNLDELTVDQVSGALTFPTVAKFKGQRAALGTLVAFRSHHLYGWVFECASLAPMPVVVEQYGGSAGSLTTPCTFTYTLKTLAGTVLKHLNTSDAIGVTPKMQRSNLGKMTAATHGLAFIGADGLWWLWWCDEVPYRGAC